RSRSLLDFHQLVFALRSVLLVLIRFLAGRRLFLKPSLLGLDHVDANLAEHRQNVFDLLGIDLIRSQQCVDLIVRDMTASLGGADERLDGRVGKVEQRPVGRGFGTLRTDLFLLLRDLACHQSQLPTPSGRGVVYGYSRSETGRASRTASSASPLDHPRLSR